jgi:hypothetical protein
LKETSPLERRVFTARGASDGIVYKITAAFRSDLSLFNKPVAFKRESRRGGIHVAP